MTDTTPPKDDSAPASQPRPKRRVIGGPPAGPSAVVKSKKSVPSDTGPTPGKVKGAPKANKLSMADMLLGAVLADRYRLEKRIGDGAMGWVFVAEHVEIGKKVAVKVLRPSLCRLPEAVSRFRREARAATTIGSKHIVDVTDFGITEGQSVFFVMEFLDGEDLSRTVKNEGALPWPRVLHILDQLCEALGAAHEQGIIHRDVKPANFYRVEVGGDPDFIKVLDFGIARLASPKDSIVTQTGVVMGTPDYMAPEQAMGKHVDERADIYSLGASAYALLTGRPPFKGANEYDVIYKQLNEEPAPPSEVAPVAAELPKWLDPIILRAMQKKPEDRYQTMKEFADAIGEARMRATNPGFVPAPQDPGSSQSQASGSASALAQPAAGGLPLWVWIAVGLLAAAGVGYMLASG